MAITALVPTLNCAATIRECLSSVAWADEILIVDSYSTDETLELCRAFTSNILSRAYRNSADQKNWALAQVKTDWVLQIDSDEHLEASLQAEIRAALAVYTDTVGYRLRRKNLVWGKWCTSNHLYPDWQLRLFRRDCGRWQDRAVHARIGGIPSPRDLQGHIIHRDVESLQSELTQFSSQFLGWEVSELDKRGVRWRRRDVTLRPFTIFLLYYFCYGGYREGFRGLYLSVFRGFYSFMTYARLYEEEIRRGLRD